MKGESEKRCMEKLKVLKIAGWKRWREDIVKMVICEVKKVKGDQIEKEKGGERQRLERNRAEIQRGPKEAAYNRKVRLEWRTHLVELRREGAFGLCQRNQQTARTLAVSS